MNFIEAVKLTKQGKKIRRTYWIKDEYVEYNNDGELIDIEGEENIFSYEDIIANDWEVYEYGKGPKTATFPEAFYALKDGKEIRRKELSFIKTVSPPFTTLDLRDKKIPGKIGYLTSERIFSYDDILAIDWIIIDED